MGFDAWYTLAIVALSFGLLAWGVAAPDIVLVGALTLLLVAGILTPDQALSGLANEGMVTVGVLYIVVTGLRETGAISWIVQNILGHPRSTQRAQIRLMTPVVAMSAFLNNTPVVAMMIPAVTEWARRHHLSVSRLMMPLSYAAIAGGTCTLIGTSTNLVVNGMLVDQTKLPGLGMFDLAWIGIPVVLTVMGTVILTSRWTLPERKPALTQVSENARGYTVEMLVEANGPLVGHTVQEAGLRHLPGLYLIEIDRQGDVIPAVAPEERLQAEDRLIFVGVVESVVDLQKIRGLVPATDQVYKISASRPDRSLIEAVVSDSCPMVGKSIRQGRFRTHYNAAIIAVSRNGEQIRGKIGDIVLRPGDTLLLEAHHSFANQQRNSRDFYLLSRLEDSTRPNHERALIALMILIAMVVSVAAGWLSMLKAALLAGGLMIITRCTRGRTARDAVDWQVLIVIAASLGIGQAISITGAAGGVAHGLMSLAGEEPRVVLGMIYLITTLFTSLITNNTAAVLMFPIGVAVAKTLGVDLMPFVVTIMIGASASFATPIGYQTNLMVMGPGGYRFSDYMRLGVPLNLLVGLIVIWLVPMIWPFVT
ncbi:MAG: TRAP transporter large permease subunit [Gammaproteobacteria bacterium]|nr:TRAP transporter large permease subunit [Gammaproteobacteria bacterium]